MIAAYDKTLFYNEASKYCVLRLMTADPMVPEDARDKYKFSDHLIRFVAVGYDLPRTDAIKMELEGNWVDSKHGRQFQVDTWHELVPPAVEGSSSSADRVDLPCKMSLTARIAQTRSLGR